MADVNVTVRKGGRQIDQIVRPLRDTGHGQAVKFRHKLWPLVNGVIDLDQPPLDTAAEAPAVVLPDPFQDGADLSQATVIGFPAEKRVLVDAGPGTGKTHVACQRIATLVNAGVAPNRIWVISFTRTAIAEFRNRIAQALTDQAEAASIRIATLDSHAWAIQSGFTPDAAMTGSYDDNIANATSRVLADEAAHEYLQRLQHLIIDEAQDVIGVRATLIDAVITQLDAGCGVTIFADEAQSIFDFTRDEHGDAPLRLTDLLRARDFSGVSLTRIHRTSDHKLRSIFLDVRRRVLSKTMHTAARCQKVRDEIVQLAHTDAGEASQCSFAGLTDNTLILMRRRADVLERSGRNSTVRHRLRMSGLPPRLLPWMAGIFWDYTGSRMAWQGFEALWNARIHGSLAVQAPPAGDAWRLLVETAGQTPTVIDVARLRSVLGRTSPPMLFCSPEYGDHGPILGTVHASKGREADEVRLFLPPFDPDASDLDEEARVCFVGATRARQHLAVGTSGPNYAQPVESGRVWRRTRKGLLQVEIGRDQDLRPEGLTGRAAFAEAGDAHRAQQAWRDLPERTDLLARQVRELDWLYALSAGDERLAVLSRSFKEDMEAVARKADKWPAANTLPFVRSIGLRTVVIPADSPDLQNLHEPWSISGFMYSPLLIGYSSGRFGPRT